MKKTVALLLTVLMLLGILPLAVSASNGTDAGIINNFKGIIDLDAQKDSAYEAFGLRKEFTLHEDVNPDNPLGNASGTIWWLFSEDYTKLNVFVEATDTDFDDTVGDSRVFNDYIKEKRKDVDWSKYSDEDFVKVPGAFLEDAHKLAPGVTPPYDNALDAARNDHQSNLFWHVDGIELFLDPENKFTNLGENEETVDSNGGAFHFKADIHGNKYAKIGSKYYFDADCDKYFDVRVNVVRNANDNGGTYTMEFVLDMTAYQTPANNKMHAVTVQQGTTMGVAASLVDHCWVESTNYINGYGPLASEYRWMVSSTYMEGVSTNTSTKSLPAAHPNMTAGGSVAFPDCGDGNHTYDNGRVTTAATCQSNGVMTYTCKLCGDSYTQTIEKDPDNHTYNFDFAVNFAKENTSSKKAPYQEECNTYVLRIDTPATCEDDGWGLVKCRYCDHSEEMALPAIGHFDRTKGSLDCTSEFPCLGSAWTVKRCKNYNRVNVYGYTPDEHETEQEHGGNFEAYAENGAPTAEHTPAADWTIKKNHKDSNEFTHTMVRLCTVCGTILEEKVVPAGGDQPEPHVHTWGDYTVIFDDCEHGKVQERRCTECGEADPVQKVDRAPGHDLEHHEAKAPTCSEIGWDAYDECKRCDYTTYHELGTTDHTWGEWVLKDGYEDDCTTVRVYTRSCTVCQTVDTNENTVSAAAAHVWGNWVIDREPTGTQKGLRHRTCENCAVTDSEEYDHEHTWGDFELKYDDCEHGKVYERRCTVSGCEATDLQVDRAPGHDLEHHDAKAQTCTEAGWDAYDTCTRCDYTTKVEKPALGHDPVHHDAKAQTCTEAGWDAYDTCTRCDYTTKVEKPALGHDPVHHDAKAQTCTEAGWDAYDTCTRCDYTTKVEKPALGHDLAHHAAKPATCTEAGYKAYDTCNRCDYTTYEAEDALGHDIKQYEAKAPSCTEAGWDAYEACTRCDYTTKVEKPALGHDPVHHDAKAPSCTEAGWDAYDTCTRCDYTTKVEKPALGHVPGEWIVEKEATETEDGYRYKKCTVCEEKVAEEVIPRLAWVNPFEDVPEDKWFYASVKYANQNNLFKGTSDTTFEPNTPMNRAMFCRVLANLEGVDNENNLTVDRFSDVLSGKWYTKAVKWAADTGIVSGYPGGIFLPEQKITRQEMCLMLANYAKYLGIYDDLAAKEDNGVAFADAAKIATWASEAVNVMKNNGYIVGKPIDGTYEFQPQATATRAEVATIFRAFCMANPTVLEK